MNEPFITLIECLLVIRSNHSLSFVLLTRTSQRLRSTHPAGDLVGEGGRINMTLCLFILKVRDPD